jgi:hypothetical protein
MFASPIFRIWFISALLCWLVLFIPVAFVGFVLGMQLLQQIPVYIIQALFLSLITSFALIYSIGAHRGTRVQLLAPAVADKAW